MADISGTRPRRPTIPYRAETSPEARALELLTTVIISVLVVTALSLGHQVFVPIAIAVLLSFVLAGPVRAIRRFGAPRTVSVLLVVGVSFIAIAMLGAVLARQATQLARDLPDYQTTIAAKIETVRGATSGSSFIERASQALQTLGRQVSRPHADQPKPAEANPRPAPEPQQPAEPTPLPVEVHQPSPGPFDVLMKVISTVIEPLATTGIVMVFVIFILLQREDLRDRMIRLAGARDISRSTAAIDDAAQRLSRFFLVQTGLNALFGMIVAIGLSIIGVPSPILWGMLAMLLRFVPYIGAFVSAAGPLALASAVDPGWNMVILTFGLFVITEPIMGQVIEPLLYGHSTGLSPIAIIVSATFWTWLWGPVGLLLSTPLTVCVVVLGRHVERLEFLDVLLGDTPPLSPVESFYQRMLAGHSAEAAEDAEAYLKRQPLSAYYDHVAREGLLMAQHDLDEGTLGEDRQLKIRDTFLEVVEDLDLFDDVAPERPKPRPPREGSDETTEEPLIEPPPAIVRDELDPAWAGPAPVLVVPGRGPLDEATAAILAQLLAKHGLPARAEGPDMLTPSRLTHLDPDGIAMACLVYLGAEASEAPVRFAVRRLRRRLPKAAILLCIWSQPSDVQKLDTLCAAANADICTASMADAVRHCVERARRKAAEPRMSGAA